MSAGRPSDYDPKHITEMLKFFQSWPEYREVEKTVVVNGRVTNIKEKVVNYPPTLNKYAIKLGVDRKTLRRWAEDNQEFRPTYDACKTIQEEWLSDRATAGEYHAGFTKLMLTNHTDIREKVVHEIGEVNLEFKSQD
jgi:hypothetical protein